MRCIGMAESALDLMLQRVTDPDRKTFGKHLYEHGTIIANIAKSRAEIDSARLLVLSAAYQIDKVKSKSARKEIGIAKFTVPTIALQVVDRAMQSFGAEGLSQDTPLASYWNVLRTLRIGDVSSCLALFYVLCVCGLALMVCLVTLGPRRSSHPTNREGGAEACPGSP